MLLLKHVVRGACGDVQNECGVLGILPWLKSRLQINGNTAQFQCGILESLLAGCFISILDKTEITPLHDCLALELCDSTWWETNFLDLTKLAENTHELVLVDFLWNSADENSGWVDSTRHL